jgi:hypothetical protein
MKNLISFSMILFLLIACKGNQELSPTATAKVVIESFYTKDNSTLKEHTTPSGYEGMIAIQNFVADGMSKSSDFKVVNDSIIGETAWVKFRTSYDTKPETFKFVRQDGKWMVTQQGVREKGPF